MDVNASAARYASSNPIGHFPGLTHRGFMLTPSTTA